MTMTVVLRELREADVADVVEACNDPLTQRYLPLLPEPYTEDDARTFVDRAEPWQLAVADEQTGRLLGTVGLEQRGAGEAELGYWTAPWARGRGVATAAAGELTARAFAAGFVRVYLRTALANGPSQRVALAAGYQREGIARGGGRRRDGSHYDLVVFSRLAGDPDGPTRRLLPDLPGGELTDGVVTLRPLGPADAEDTFVLRSLPEVSARSVSPTGVERAAIEEMCANSEARWLAGERAAMTIRDARTDTYAGDLGFFYDNPMLQAAMIGYSLLPAWRGRGYASRAVRLITTWAFDHVGIVRLTAGTAPDNVASQRVLEAAGFTREAFQRALLPGPDGTRIDNIMFVRYMARQMTP
jgi:RimJ/RimL family protein N-acetyltransferase